MRIQLILLTLLFSSLASAVSDKEVSEVFAKYDTIVREHKFNLVDEVFTKKFLKDVGGKEEFIQNIKEFPRENNKSNKALPIPTKIQWKKGVRDEIFFAKKIEVSNLKSNTGTEHKSDKSFVLKKEDGKLKIDGTISDDH